MMLDLKVATELLTFRFEKYNVVKVPQPWTRIKNKIFYLKSIDTVIISATFLVK